MKQDEDGDEANLGQFQTATEAPKRGSRQKRAARAVAKESGGRGEFFPLHHPMEVSPTAAGGRGFLLHIVGVVIDVVVGVGVALS